MIDMENVIKGLNDIGGFIAGRLEFEHARNFLRTIDDALEMLKEQEAKIEQLNRFVNGFSRDAMPVVRCKDCEYALFKEGVVEHGYIACTKPYTERWQVAKPDNWFCADGKRKEGR